MADWIQLQQTPYKTVLELNQLDKNSHVNINGELNGANKNGPYRISVCYLNLTTLFWNATAVTLGFTKYNMQILCVAYD